MNLVLRFWFHILRFFDEVVPGWSMPATRIAPEREGGPGYLGAESLNYWLTAERYRRGRD